MKIIVYKLVLINMDFSCMVYYQQVLKVYNIIRQWLECRQRQFMEFYLECRKRSSFKYCAGKGIYYLFKRVNYRIEVNSEKLHKTTFERE